MLLVRYILLLCNCPEILLVLLHSIDDFLQSVEYTTDIVRTK